MYLPIIYSVTYEQAMVIHNVTYEQAMVIHNVTYEQAMVIHNVTYEQAMVIHNVTYEQANVMVWLDKSKALSGCPAELITTIVVQCPGVACDVVSMAAITVLQIQKKHMNTAGQIHACH